MSSKFCLCLVAECEGRGKEEEKGLRVTNCTDCFSWLACCERKAKEQTDGCTARSTLASF
jgi:hypothetical protein